MCIPTQKDLVHLYIKDLVAHVRQHALKHLEKEKKKDQIRDHWSGMKVDEYDQCTLKSDSTIIVTDSSYHLKIPRECQYTTA